jgi:small subunit ribosomal protein S8
MVNDHLSDFITRIRNGYRAGLPEISVPYTKAVFGVASVLEKEKYVEKVEKQAENLVIKLRYEGKRPAIMGVRRVSKPGLRVYSAVSNLPRVWGGLGKNIVSTTKGVVSERQAKKLNLGGEVICQVW